MTKPNQDVCPENLILLQMLESNIFLIGMNCEKNAVVCEGYHEKQVWKSGKERAEEGML